MSSDTDSSTTSSSSSSSDNYKKRKSSKKHKKKSDKKHKKLKKEKRHKLKKRARRHSHSSSDSETKVKKLTVLAPRGCVEATAAVADDDLFGPALPPHLLQKPTAPTTTAIIGPVMPIHLQQPTEMEAVESTTKLNNEKHDVETEELDAVGIYGPMPVGKSETVMSAAQIELEQRALELKLAAIDGASGKNVDQKVREEWMLELPDVGLKGGLAALSNLKRTFHQGKERPDFSDRTSWTKTPQSQTNPQKAATSKSAAESLKDDAQKLYTRQRDEEQERIARKHKKKHKREESLVELHQKKLRKEQRKKEKELAAAGAKPERRRFTRDIDLKLNKIDKNQTKQIVDKAKILNTKFSSGHTKYL